MATPLYAEQVKNTEFIIEYLEDHIELFEETGADDNSLGHLRMMAAFETHKLEQLKRNRPDIARR